MTKSCLRPPMIRWNLPRLRDAWGVRGVYRQPMRKVRIVRDAPSPLGTFGVLSVVDSGFSCYSGELNWHDNKTGISCIPVGIYKCVIGDSPKFGKVYGVLKVPGRTEILLHYGNFCADDGVGKRDIEGCVLLGNAIGEIAKQKALLSSKDALMRFHAEMEGEPFELSIEWGPGLEP